MQNNQQEEVDDALVILNYMQKNPKVSTMTRKQETIQRVKPWEVSAIARSLPMKNLKAFYRDLYDANLAQE